jgi:hypothetical protein
MIIVLRACGHVPRPIADYTDEMPAAAAQKD